MLLQAYDFLHLYQAHGVTLQSAGADQWGNIVSGIDLIRRAAGHGSESTLAYGLTAPLLTKADGGKFGKTESGSIWLSHHRPSGQPGTSPYAYYQFWFNAADHDVRRFLFIFTDLSLAEVDALTARHLAAPAEREAQRTLARQATALLHGESAARDAEAAAHALFSGNIAHLDASTLDEVFASAPSTIHPCATLAGEGVPLSDIIAQTSLAKSKREAREHLGAGAITLNGEKAGPDDRLTAARLLHGSVALFRRGRKAWHVTRWE